MTKSSRTRYFRAVNRVCVGIGLMLMLAAIAGCHSKGRVPVAKPPPIPPTPDNSWKTNRPDFTTAPQVPGRIMIIPKKGVSADHPGFITIQLGPPAALEAGAAWRIAGAALDYSTNSVFTIPVASTNQILVEFRPLTGWDLPEGRPFYIGAGAHLTNIIVYNVPASDVRRRARVGGPITIHPIGFGTGDHATITFIMGPPAAIVDGAGWRVTNTSPVWSSTSTFDVPVGAGADFLVQFKEIDPQGWGWGMPDQNTIPVAPGQHVTNYSNYKLETYLVFSNYMGLGILGGTGTVYQIQASPTLTKPAWTPILTNTIISNGFNLLVPFPFTNPPSMFFRARWLP